MKNEKRNKKQFKVTDDYNQLTHSQRKNLLLVLYFINEAGDISNGKTLLKNRWLRKIYPLPRPNDPTYNTRKAVRSAYWVKLNSMIKNYIIEI
ncbi:hypothetical protein [Gaetbulibacter saemankumensis]|uniref:hypothetical protein n=1 Tax=Gaetbulibacter saemankumensis TaxID=311208 RepID=UPI0004137E5B|nr:hypothetical protein [Gaetbulibacter saemankumensis]